MTTGAKYWAWAFARQADADFRAWELFGRYPAALAAECHKLLLLQMACEKLCKAYLITAGASPSVLQSSHGYVAKNLPLIIKQQIVHSGARLDRMAGLLIHVRHLANEIELLGPLMTRAGQRPENCEYPWTSGGGKICSPLDWTFPPSDLLIARAGVTFVKLLRGAIDRTLEEVNLDTSEDD